MKTANDDALQLKRLTAARTGDQEAFASLIEPYRPELLAHCYRIMGSLQDAEDGLQETLLRAWRRLDSFEGRSTLRAWLYKVATNVCLDALDARGGSRSLPTSMSARGDPNRPLPASSPEILWIEPFPDTWTDGQPDAYPEAQVELRESITLAFIAALQKLPGRQRAVLLLRDVMGWNAAETAQTLDMSTAAVNSALQRARETMKRSPERSSPYRAAGLDEPLNSLLGSYVAAWEAADSAALVATLREDVRLTMPPLPLWFEGRQDIQAFLDGYLFRSITPFRVRLLPARSNASPAFALYQMDGSGVYRAAALHVLTISDGGIWEVHDFLTFDGRLFSSFGLPLTA
jgi:RNA polymerase sigma-70 factor, ECF subfamily